MNRLVMIEAIHNFFDCAVFIEILRNSLNVNLEMEAKDFIRHLMFGKGYFEITPPELSRQMVLSPDLLIVDLRDEEKYKENHIMGAVSHPFDDFLKSILIEGKYKEFRQKKLVLVCDTGHQSRVAASILTEEGFMKVHNLNRGMHRFNKWHDLQRLGMSAFSCC